MTNKNPETSQPSAAHLEILSALAQQSASGAGLDALMQTAVDQLCTRLGYEFAAVHLLDERSREAVQQAAAVSMVESLDNQTPAIPPANGRRIKVGGDGLVGFVTATGRHRLTQDNLAALYPWLTGEGGLTAAGLTALALPLSAGTQILGALEVLSRRPAAFDAAELNVLQTAASLLAAAASSSSLVSAAGRQLDELIALHRLADIVTNASDEDYLYEQITSLVIETLAPLSFGFLRVDEENKALVCHPSFHARQVVQFNRCAIPFGQGMVGLAAEQQRAWLIPDLEKEREASGLDPAAHSAISLPVLVGDRLAGVLHIERQEANAFDRSDQRLLETIARQLSTALGKIRSLNALQRRAVEMNSLREAGLQLNASLDLNAILRAVLYAGQSLAVLALGDTPVVCTSTAQVLLFDGEKLDLGLALLPDGSIQPVENLLPDPPTTRLLGTRQPVVIADTGGHYLFSSLPNLGAVICLPLLHSGELWGALNLYFSQPLEDFDQEKLRVLLLFADQAAAALVNARQYAVAGARAEVYFTAFKQRESAVQTRKEFMQNFSHELRTPLAIARGYAELLENAELGELNSEQKNAVSILNRRVQMLTLMVDDLVTLLETENLQGRRENFDLAAMLRQLSEDYTPTVRQHELELHAEIAAGPLMVNGVAHHLSRLVDNLISNAVKYSPPGGTITLRLSQADSPQNGRSQAVLEVLDQGVGIQPDQIERIFERFYRADPDVRRGYAGSGLGLALVREIAEAHGGSVSVESALSKGSRFTVRLPGV